MRAILPKGVPGPELSAETLRRLEILFAPGDHERARVLLYEQCGYNLAANPSELERLRIAALKCSDGNLAQLESALKLAQRDWRDLLVAAGFANGVRAHLTWEPKPAGEPAEIDAGMLAATIHERLAALLIPLGFARQGDTWRRDGEVPQILLLQTGLTSRIQVKFFIKFSLEAKPKGVLLHLPPVPAMANLSDQGYIFRAGENAEARYEAVVRDVVHYCQPWIERFTSNDEVRRGFEDGSFAPHLPMKEGWALVLPRRSG